MHQHRTSSSSVPRHPSTGEHLAEKGGASASGKIAVSLPVRLLLLMFSAVAGGRVDVAESFAAALGDAEVAAEDVVGKATGGRDHDLRLL